MPEVRDDNSGNRKQEAGSRTALSAASGEVGTLFHGAMVAGWSGELQPSKPKLG